jgi:shikimate 5-dehydrogenase
MVMLVRKTTLEKKYRNNRLQIGNGGGAIAVRCAPCFRQGIDGSCKIYVVDRSRVDDDDVDQCAHQSK